MENHNMHPVAKDFSKEVRKSLKTKGIKIYGSTFVPDLNGDFCNGERAYLLDYNGTSRVRSYLQVRELAGC